MKRGIMLPHLLVGEKMAIQSGFYNSISGDRKYNCDDFAKYLGDIISNGVIPRPSSALQVMATGNGMNIIVRPGKGRCRGRQIENDADYPITVEAADIVFDRIDSVIIADYPKSKRKMDIEIRKGTPASTPVPPTILRTEDEYDLVLANIYVAAKTETITQSAITDMRPDESSCGWVTGLIEQIELGGAYEQWQDAFSTYYEQTKQRMNDWYQSTSEGFDTWLNGIKESISTATLLRKYQSSYTAATDNTSAIPINIPAAAYNVDLDIIQVYVNGMNLIPTVDYTVESAQQIMLTKPIRTGTVVNIEIFKSVDGSNAVTAIEMIEALQTQVVKLRADVDQLLQNN